MPPVTAVPTAITAFAGVSTAGRMDTPVVITSVRLLHETFGETTTPLHAAVRLFFANGGTDAIVVRVDADGRPGDDALSAPELEREGRGLWALRAGGAFDLLSVPALAFGAGADVSARTRRAALALCKERHAMYVVDPLASWSTVDDVLRGPEGLDSAVWGLPRDEDTALYLPRLIVIDPATGDTLTTGAPGAVAGVMARTDRQRGVWRAPAGTEASVQGVSGVSPVFGDAEQRQLNPAGINVVRPFAGRGFLLWGARTLRGDDASASEWKYVAVRRLALFLERSIDASTTWAVSEPGGEALWSGLRRDLGNFLHQLFREGAFAGRSDRESWFVKCDAQTTTQADIDAGRTNVVVGVAPLKPAEFVILEIAVPTAPVRKNP